MHNPTTFAPQAATFRGARKYLESISLTRQGMKVSGFDCYLDLHKENDGKLHSGAGVSMVHIAPFVLGQKNFRDNVS